MPRSATQEWLSENALIAYPIKEDANRQLALNVAPSVTFDLPENFLLDAVFTAPKEFLDKIAISSLSTSVTGAITTVSIELSNPDIPEVLITLDALSTSFGTKRNQVLSFSAVIPAYDAAIPILAGRLVVGLAGFQTVASAPLGSYTPTTTFIHFEDSVLKDNPLAKVKSVGDFITPLVGDVKLCEGYNVSITRDEEQNGFRVDAIVGAGRGQFCGTACDDPQVCNNAVSSINGIPSDVTNFFTLLGRGAVEIRRDPDNDHTLIIGTTVDPATLCQRTGIPGRPGGSGPVGPRGPTGNPADPEQCELLCPCQTCEVCDTCEVGDGLKTCVTCETCDTCEMEANCDPVFDIPPPPPPPPPPPQCENNDIPNPLNPQPSGLVQFVGEPFDPSLGQGLILPPSPLDALPNLEGARPACNCTAVRFGIVTEIVIAEVNTIIWDFLENGGSGSAVVPDPEVPSYSVGDTILVQTFDDGSFDIFPLT